MKITLALLKLSKKQRRLGADKMSPKLMQLADNFLSKRLSNSVNFGFASGIFPVTAVVSPVEKETDNKKIVSNFRPVSVLTTFSKIHELKTKELACLSLR